MALFIPRDAGFLSVLNWYVSVRCLNEKVYPFVHREVLELVNKRCNHFCYYDTNVENSWFLFFEPTDYTHKTIDLQTVLHHVRNNRYTQGWEGRKELMFFPIADRFRKSNQVQFQKWRNEINALFRRNIRYSVLVTETIAKKERAFTHVANVPNMRSFVGVHYRNPSHCKEQGIVHFKDYFKCIDTILEKHPSQRIFLATDTELGVAVFKNRYGSRLIYDTDVHRTSADDFLDWCFARSSHETDGEGLVGGKGYDAHAKLAQNHDNELGKDMGVEVLVDAELLSRCSHFVHTVSNMTIAVSYLNPDVILIPVKEDCVSECPDKISDESAKQPVSKTTSELSAYQDMVDSLASTRGGLQFQTDEITELRIQ